MNISSHVDADAVSQDIITLSKQCMAPALGCPPFCIQNVCYRGVFSRRNSKKAFFEDFGLNSYSGAHFTESHLNLLFRDFYYCIESSGTLRAV